MRRYFTRRDFLKLLKARATDLALLALGGAAHGYFVEPAHLKVESIHLRLQRLTRAFHGLRIVQLSDIHMGGWMNAARFQQIADLVRGHQPDLLFLTGDFLVGHTFDQHSEENLQDLVNILSPLTKTIPTFAVL